MEFNFNIKNLGNIKQANIQVKPFTIIAGENGTGKSFATKSLYSVLDTLNRDYVTKKIFFHVRDINRFFSRFIIKLKTKSKIDKDFIQDFEKIITPKLSSIVEEYSSADLKQQSSLADNMIDTLEIIYSSVEYYYNSRKDLVKFLPIKNDFQKILQSLNEIKNIIQDNDESLIDGINSNIDNNLKKNFQLTDFKPLIHEKADGMSLEIDSIGTINTNKQGQLGFSLSPKGIMEIQKLDNIIFLDSPVYLKLQKALENRGRIFNFGIISGKDKYLKNYPLYIDNLYSFLEKQYIDTPDFYDLSLELRELMQGRLHITKSGNIEYQNNNGISTPLSLTAMGISNIGLIDLLLSNNIINKGSFLIIDEPEAHLHPKWQVALATILYKVAKKGANIIMATHSLDIIKTVESLLKSDEESQKYIAINKMPYDKKFNALSDIEKAENIIEDLSTPFYNLYMNGVKL